MELKDIKKEHLIGKRIIIVLLSGGSFLSFLVSDCMSPQVPGFPACALSYDERYKRLKKRIEKIYKRCNYYPKFHKIEGWFY